MNKTSGRYLTCCRNHDWCRDVGNASHLCGDWLNFATVFLLLGLWAVLTFTALLFVELYQTADSDAGIGTLAAQYFGKAGRIISTAVLIVFLYALIAAYVSGGGSLLMDLLPAMGDKDTMNKIAVLVFTIFFGSFIVIGTHSVDKINRVLFFVMIAAFILVLALMLPNIKFDNLMAMPIDNALIISASPVFLRHLVSMVPFQV